jgi:hypothetical protein
MVQFTVALDEDRFPDRSIICLSRRRFAVRAEKSAARLSGEFGMEFDYGTARDDADLALLGDDIKVFDPNRLSLMVLAAKA